MSTQVDVNAIIGKLSNKLSEANVTIAVLEAQVDALTNELAQAKSGIDDSQIEVVTADDKE